MPRRSTLNPERRRLRSQPPASDDLAGAVLVDPVRVRGPAEPAAADRAADERAGFVAGRDALPADRAGFAVAPAARLDEAAPRGVLAASADGRRDAEDRCFAVLADDVPSVGGVPFGSPPAGIDGFFTGASRTRRRLSGVAIGTPESLQVTMLRR
jgi:hypothetical protein